MSRDIYKSNFEEAISKAITNYLEANPTKVKINGGVEKFSKIDEVHSHLKSPYSENDLLKGVSIRVNVDGQIFFKGVNDFNSAFSLTFSCTSIEASYSLENDEFKISEPKNIVLSIF